MFLGFLLSPYFYTPAVMALLLQEMPASPVVTHGLQGALAVGGFWFYREDRQRSEERLKCLASDFRETIKENAAANATICSKMDELIRAVKPKGE
jgi:hypothetical protein